MARSDELKDERRRYERLRENLDGPIIDEIKIARSELQDASLEQVFSIDYESADNGCIINLISKCESMESKIVTLLSVIADKINELDRKIIEAEEEEAEMQ